MSEVADVPTSHNAGSNDEPDEEERNVSGGSESGSGSESSSASDSSSSDSESSEDEGEAPQAHDGNVPLHLSGLPPTALAAQEEEDGKENGGYSDGSESDSGSASASESDGDGDSDQQISSSHKGSSHGASSSASSSAAESGGEARQNQEGEDSESSQGGSPTQSSETSSEDDADDYVPNRSKRQAARKAPVEKRRAPVKKKRRMASWRSDASEQSGDDSENSPPPTKRRATAAAKSKNTQKRRNAKSCSTDDSDEAGHKRHGGKRRVAAAVSYKEQSVEKTDSEDLVEMEYDETQTAGSCAVIEEEKCETIERIIAKRRGKVGCTGNPTTVYAIEECGYDPNEGADEKDEENTEWQYLIKWKDWSYIHCTWESEISLKVQNVKGMKKLDNYIKKELENESWRLTAGVEDIDYHECQLELQNDLLKSYNFVDRIIACNDKGDGSREYLCKWQSLPYADATWEDSILVIKKWSHCIEQFEERQNSKCTPSRHCKVLKCRPKFYKIKEQPEFINEGITLRDYQMDGLNWLLHSWCKENSVILADEMGLGKTIQTICFLNALFKTYQLYGPFLCVVPLSTMTAWQREFDIWAPEMNVVTYLGDVKSREIIRQFEWQFESSKRLKFNCILTTYEIVMKDHIFLGTLQWAALLVDEAHRLKNDDSLLYKTLKQFNTSHRLLITGTPLQNSLKELWALLHFIMPEKFPTWEEFETEHDNAADKGYAKLHQQLEPYILRRVKKDVEKSLPAKVEQILRVEMTSKQKQFYKWILTRNFDALRKGKRGSTSTFLNIVIELKKCCNHAALIKPSEFEVDRLPQDEALQKLLRGSGKLVLLDKLLCRLKETGHRVLIFSQMVRMLDVLAEYLQKRHFSFQRLDGSIKGEMRRQALDHFNAEGSQDFCFLLSTRAGGLGINLATADTVIIFDSDWNPQNDLQAQARAHRIGQKNQVNIYRLVTARSVEEQIVERAKQKMVLDHLIIQRMDTTGRTVLDKSGASSANSAPFNKDDLSEILKFGAEELFKDEQDNDEEPVCDIDEILRRAETRNEDPEMPGDDLLSAFKVASIAAFEEEPTDRSKGGTICADEDDEDSKDWDDIIPEEFRRKIEEKERAKELEELYLLPRRKTTAASATNEAKKANKLSKSKTNEDSAADSDYEVGSDASDENRPRKRGRPTMKEKVAGFTDAEIRRFIRSYKKFPAPLLRLEAIACDAELQEKPLSELKRIGEMLHDRCVQFLEEHKEDELQKAANNVTNAAPDENGKPKRPRATYSIKFGGVSFNAKTLLSSEEELNPLNELMPKTAAERLEWSFDIKTRPANFDVEWGIAEDSKLLCGIYQYGIGSWEQMKMDPTLKLSDKILANDASKPQSKHLHSRAEYLLKIIKKNVELKRSNEQRNQRKQQRRPRETAKTVTPAATSANTDAVESQSIIDKSPATTAAGDAEKTSKRNQHKTEGGTTNNGEANAEKASSSSKSKKKSKRSQGDGNGEGKSKSSRAKRNADKPNKPMHFTANNQPHAVEVLGELDPSVFLECKDKMRPLKKILKSIETDKALSNQEQEKVLREKMLPIGKHIDQCIEQYEDDKKNEWRSKFWYFVSIFTEYDGRKLFKWYKQKLRAAADTPNTSAEGVAAESSSSPTKTASSNKDRDKNLKKKRKDKERTTVAADGSSTKHDRNEKARRYEPPLNKSTDLSATATAVPQGANVNGQWNGLRFKRSAAELDSPSSRSFEDRSKRNRDDYHGGTGGYGTGSNNRSYSNSRHHPSAYRGNYAPASSNNPDARHGYANGSGTGDHWGHGHDRYNSSYNRRDRYGYREHRDRDRDRDRDRGDHRRHDKRRYLPPNSMPPHAYPAYPPPPPPSLFYIPNAIAPQGAVPPPNYRDPRFLPHEYGPDYRRSDYDRRPPLADERRPPADEHRMDT